MSEIPKELVDELSGRYELRGVVGRGGMATVYGATDLKHNRKVAIKVLRPELSANLGAERFLREIEIAAQLQHPHILMLIDSGQAIDTFYYVMPFVDGGSLRARIDKGRFGLEDATTTVERVADALCYAHQQGVVHRDIKPENILFSRGYPLVADFGIAKAISTAGVTALTRTGFPLGTVGYMSPEQAAGSSELGPASDVYSLACVAYEMLVGAVPGVWLSDVESDEGRMRDIPSEHRSLLDGLPGHVEPALARALARRPGDRFEDPAEFVAALTGKQEVKKRFSEQQVGEIMRHAAESQFAKPTTDGSLTVGAIEAIAADVGLSPERVHEAIMQLDASTNAPALPMKLFSLPAHLEMETTVVGEVPQSEFGSLLEEIHLNLKDVGVINDTMGKALSWQTSGFEEAGRTRIMVRPKRGETKLSITQSTLAYKGGVTIASVVGGGALAALMIAIGEIEGISAASGIGQAMIAVTVAALPGAIVAGRFFLRRVLKKRRKKLEALLHKLAKVAREAIEDSTTS
ncbi:MAG: serine/threonine-protein kinase [Gemmatimonadales bacterium]